MNKGCFHCGLPLPAEGVYSHGIEGEEREFCCLGCQTVCETIYASGMQGFYQRTPEGTLLSPPPPPPKDLGLYDLESVQQEFVIQKGDEREINLLVEGIHCAACVWLIERQMARTPGVIRASVNLSGKRLHLSWNQKATQLSELLQQLSSIGYAAIPFDPELADGKIKRQNQAMLFRMAFAGFTMMNLLWISIALYSGADKGEFRSLFQWIGFALATPTLLYSGWPFLKGAWSGLRHLHLTMDLPIALGATVTWAYSTYVTLNPEHQGEVYFDTVVNFLFVILVGRFLEAISKRHAVAATQRLLDLQPKIALQLIDGQEQFTQVKSLKAGDLVLVKPGDKIPVDGTITVGKSQIDESMLSGESKPVAKGIGDRIYAGTLNSLNPLTIRVEATLRQSTLGKIVDLVEKAQSSKAPIQCTADRIVPWFVATTLILASFTFIYWVDSDFEMALMAATSVLIITCPCAFGLATPMAISVASGLGARHGILIKNGAVLETLSAITHFIFDKTGTLTSGKMEVLSSHNLGESDPKALLRKAAAVERLSEHPLARAITRQADDQQLGYRQLKVNNYSYQPGLGVSASIDHERISIGSIDYLRDQKIEINPELQRRAEAEEKHSQTAIHLATGTQHQGLFMVRDRLRDDAKELITHLHQQGISTTLLSGDRLAVAHAVASELSARMEVISGVRPDQKHRVIAERQQQGVSVVMVGDGVNDAPALIQADVGIAIGSGTDVSVESADIVLMDDELMKIDLAARLSRRTLRTIRQNIAISFAYNIIMVPLAMSGWVTPLVAAISMPISSLLVIGNAARIRTLFKRVN